MSTIRLKTVVTPTTVEGFREHLRRFFLTEGLNELKVRGSTKSIPIDELSGFSDIYRITGTGFFSDGSSPMIAPSVDYDLVKVRDFMMRTGQWFSAYGFFDDEDNFDLYEVTTHEQQVVYITKAKSVCWQTLDNQILREFYAKVLGEFCGYGDFGDSVEEEVTV